MHSLIWAQITNSKIKIHCLVMSTSCNNFKKIIKYYFETTPQHAQLCPADATRIWPWTERGECSERHQEFQGEYSSETSSFSQHNDCPTPPPLSFENFTLLPPFFLPFNTCFIVIYTRGMGICSCTTTSRCVHVRACVCVQVCLI